jgi:hypothetical protein
MNHHFYLNIADLSEDVQQYLAIRQEAALKIDPATAEVNWWYAQVMDPYGIDPDWVREHEECQQVGREYFACAPGSDIWVWFGDLPEATQKAAAAQT